MGAAEAKILSDVETYGWHMITVAEDREGPGFTYSIGLFKSYGHPEVIVQGLPIEVMQRIVDAIAALVKGGATFHDGDETTDVLENCACTFRAVRPERYREHFGCAMWFYKETGFPALQCVWPDNQGRYPWNQRCQEGIRKLQPALYEPPAVAPPSSDVGGGGKPLNEAGAGRPGDV